MIANFTYWAMIDLLQIILLSNLLILNPKHSLIHSTNAQDQIKLQHLLAKVFRFMGLQVCIRCYLCLSAFKATQ